MTANFKNYDGGVLVELDEFGETSIFHPNSYFMYDAFYSELIAAILIIDKKSGAITSVYSEPSFILNFKN